MSKGADAASLPEFLVPPGKLEELPKAAPAGGRQLKSDSWR
jgi:hypothetical protein